MRDGPIEVQQNGQTNNACLFRTVLVWSPKLLEVKLVCFHSPGSPWSILLPFTPVKMKNQTTIYFQNSHPTTRVYSGTVSEIPYPIWFFSGYPGYPLSVRFSMEIRDEATLTFSRLVSPFCFTLGLGFCSIRFSQNRLCLFGSCPASQAISPNLVAELGGNRMNRINS